MSFNLTQPSGWAFGEILTSGQMEDIDAKTADAVDGVGGGTYAPSTVLTFGGKGLAVTGPFACSGTATFTGDVNIGNSSLDTCTINATVTFLQDIDFANDVRLGHDGGDNINVDGNLVCSLVAQLDAGFEAVGDSTVTGSLEISQDLTVGDDLEVSGNTTLVGNTTANGNVTLGSSSSDDLTLNAQLTNRLNFTGSGRVGLRVRELDDASQTVTIADGNVLLVPGVTASRAYTLSSSGAVDGADFFEVHLLNSFSSLAHSVQFRKSNGSTLFTISADAIHVYYRLVFWDGDWKVMWAYSVE